MSKSALHAYVQTRLQARHGERLAEDEWRRLRSISDFGNYLQVAQRSSLNDWVAGISVKTSVHEIELLLRQRYRSYVDELSRWLGDDWRQSISWVKRLIDLPALGHILSGHAASGWMLDDPELKPFVHVNENQRDEALLESDCRIFLEAWRKQEPLAEAWFRQWKTLCPLQRHQQLALEQIARPIRFRLWQQCESPDDSTEMARESLESEFRGAFRRLSGGPEIIFVHLGLIALDIERLRGDLVRRALFEGQKEGVSS